MIVFQNNGGWADEAQSQYILCHAYDQSFPVGRLFRCAEYQPAHSGNLYGFPESCITVIRNRSTRLRRKICPKPYKCVVFPFRVLFRNLDDNLRFVLPFAHNECSLHEDSLSVSRKGSISIYIRTSGFLMALQAGLL